jgi:hypothetical protein
LVPKIDGRSFVSEI